MVELAGSDTHLYVADAKRVRIFDARQPLSAGPVGTLEVAEFPSLRVHANRLSSGGRAWDVTAPANSATTFRSSCHLGRK